MALTSRSIIRAALLCLLVLGFTSCAKPVAPATPVTKSTVVASTPANTATSTPSPSATATTTLHAPLSQPTATPSVSLAEPQPGPLLDVAWGDRAIYRSGLVAEERAALDKFSGASEYRLDLVVSMDPVTITGQQQVSYTNREDEPLGEILLRMFPNYHGGMMDVSEILVDGLQARWEEQFERSAVQVTLPEPLSPGASTVLALDYRITVPDRLETGYGLLSYVNGILALDTPYAPIPVYNDHRWNVEIPPENADTSFNDPSFYLVRMTAPAELTLVASGVEVERHLNGAQQIVTFAVGPARDFFVAASDNYVLQAGQIGETRVHSYAAPGEEEGASLALRAAMQALEVFEKRFGPYPYSELDIAATPMLALGIEYPGTVGISEKVYDPKGATDLRAQLIESTVAHEVAHQWFYNLVGSDQIDEPWLDEALAQYSTWLYYLERYGEEGAEGWRESWEARWQRTDRNEKPVGLAAREYEGREYSSIVYGRGPLFLAALAERMGQATFDQFLKDYAARFRWGIATTEAFKELARQACGCDLDNLYREWLNPQ